jgi:hypothetical protein
MEMQKRVVVGNRLKDSIQYSDVFDGKEAVVSVLSDSCFVSTINLTRAPHTIALFRPF